jgi:hypothetical protein
VVVDAPAAVVDGDDVDKDDEDLILSIVVVVTPPPIVPGGGARLPARIRLIDVDNAALAEGMDLP